MAKTATGPDTATSQWFVNLANNARNLDNQNGGFTVFARVTAPGLAVADKIAALPVYNASWVASVGSAMTELPVLVRPVTASLARANVVIINQVTELPTAVR
jgi:peptidyl-prolyl cis-trans isomerase A (cyclophilin A)